MTDKRITIEVNGIELEARPGQMLMEVTDRAGIYIPRFCYHEKLSVAANCRMCLVDVENAGKPVPACAAPVMDGMKVQTRSAAAIAAQKATMEFLLINHPLDCPICDQGGECELQDLAMGFGRGVSRYTEGKRVVNDKNLGPLISTDMTRCIQCTRCVRFGQEIAGIQELGTIGRSEQMEIGTYIERSVDHELSGNNIDICPVGALNNKPFRFRARAWEMLQHETIGPHDPVGSNLYAHVLRGRLMRVVPNPNDDINETWISDRDRFSCHGVDSDQRLSCPMVKHDGNWAKVDWEDALSVAAAGLHEAIGAHGAAELGVLASAGATTEEGYLLQRLARGLGSNNIDHRLRQADFKDADQDPAYPALGVALEDIDTLDALLVAGSNLRMEVPLLAHRVRKAALAGGKVSFINAHHYDYLFPVARYLETGAESLVDHLAALVLAASSEAGKQKPEFCKALLDREAVTDDHRAIVRDLESGENTTIVLGQIAARHPRFADIRALAATLADLTRARFGYISEGANSAGAWLAGVLPHRGPGGHVIDQPGRHAGEMLTQSLKAYLLFGFEPDADCRNGATAMKALAGAQTIVAVTPWLSESLLRVADILLPMGTFAETAGTFVNCEGRWQSFGAVASPIGEARPGWKILRVLANQCGLENFDYSSCEDIRSELEAKIGRPEMDNTLPTDRKLDAGTDGDDSILDVPMYQVDGLVRRSQPLQATYDARRVTGDAA
ncbi:MAG: NADH-quinone oxidoreductase subunit NuoG [Gammaproteobacteria bacterium]